MHEVNQQRCREASFEEMGELMHAWVLREDATFTVAGSGNLWKLIRISRERHNVAWFLKELFTHYGAVQELGAALTLFDALVLKVDSPHQVTNLIAEELTEPASLAAIARLVLKCSGLSLFEVPPFSVVEGRLGLGEALQMDLVTSRELQFFAIMDGHVAGPALPAPERWLDLMLQRLDALATLSPEHSGELELAQQIAQATIDALLVRMGMSPVLPPRALALGCCVLGLVAVGAVSAEDVRPKDVLASDWDSLLMLWLGRPSNLARHGPALSMDLESLAMVVCCSPNELQHWVFNSVQGFQDKADMELLDA